MFGAPLLLDSGLTYPQYLVMCLLWTDGPQTVTGLARRLALDPSTLSPLLQRLETRGLLDRTRDRDDQRLVSVTASAAGHALAERLQDVTAAVSDASGMSAEDQDDLVRTLQSLTGSLTATLTPA